ncbi:MAG: hypothetical protein E7665_03095 [Ruminococcaceae bacterium]|nr:hypothetical protein [Oscillospiraceae bacterium]
MNTNKKRHHSLMLRYRLTRLIIPVRTFLLFFSLPLISFILIFIFLKKGIFPQRDMNGKSELTKESHVSLEESFSLFLPELFILSANNGRESHEDKGIVLSPIGIYLPHHSLSGIANGVFDMMDTHNAESLFLGEESLRSESSFTEEKIILPSVLPEGYIPVMRTDLAYKTFDIINDTDYKLDRAKLDNAEYPFLAPSKNGPSVLIVHTHATEAFYEDDSEVSYFKKTNPSNDEKIAGYYLKDSAAPRSSDTSENMVRVGEIFAATLESLGISVIHDKTLHDLNNYNGAYQSTYKTVSKYIEKYPTVQYILDIHRDSLIKSDGTKLAPTTVIDGKPAAQVMLVVGSDGSGYYHPNWRSNLSLALRYRSYLGKVSDEFVRPIYLRTGRFNQQVSVGSMLLEIGSCGSTLEEAENAAVYAARALADMIYSNT